jgi:type II secretory pathway pseudopilin PulG
MLEKTKGQGGITLVALVVTIVVLLILAGITIALVFAQNGVVGKAPASSNKGTIADNIQGYIVSKQMEALQTNKAPGDVTADMTTKLQAAGITVTASSNTISIAADTTVTISGDITFELNGQTYTLSTGGYDTGYPELK